MTLFDSFKIEKFQSMYIKIIFIFEPLMNSKGLGEMSQLDLFFDQFGSRYPIYNSILPILMALETGMLQN